jgi:hypothetical protein
MAKKAKRKLFKKLHWVSIWTDSKGTERIDLQPSRKVARTEAAGDRSYGIPSRVARVRITEVR